MLKFLLFFIFMSLMPSLTHAASYYFDCENGNDSASGLDSSHPWKTPTKISGLNFLQPDDHVLFNKGTTCSGALAAFTVNSSGTEGHPIVFEPYGSGADPIFDGSLTTAQIAGWTGWTQTDATKHIWRSNIVLPFRSTVPRVDGTSTLALNNYGTFFKCRYNNSYAGDYMYVRMCDQSDPNGHAFTFAKYPIYPDNLYGGLVQFASGTGYINVDHFRVIGSTIRGIRIDVPHVNITNTVAEYNGQDGFLYSTYGDSNSDGGAYGSCTNCTARWNNGAVSGGSGQNFTVEAHDVIVDNALIEYGWMAGFDVLDFHAGVDVHSVVLKNSIVRYNSQRAMWGYGCAEAAPYSDTAGYDPQVYIDGGHHVAILNNVITGNTGNSTYCSTFQQTLTTGVAIGGENVNKTPHDVYVLNNLITSNGYGLLSTHVETGIGYNYWNIGNTFTAAYLAVALYTDPVKGRTAHHYNNIIRSNFVGYRSITDSDYNIFDVTNSSSNIGFLDTQSVTMTIAQWQSASGQDSHSLTTAPLYVSLSIPYDFHLQHIASGQASNSPALSFGIANPNNIQNQFSLTSIGTTRTDDVADNPDNPDLGYHFNQIIDSWSFTAIPQNGTTWIPGGTIQ